MASYTVFIPKPSISRLAIDTLLDWMPNAIKIKQYNSLDFCVNIFLLPFPNAFVKHLPKPLPGKCLFSFDIEMSPSLIVDLEIFKLDFSNIWVRGRDRQVFRNAHVSVEIFSSPLIENPDTKYFNSVGKAKICSTDAVQKKAPFGTRVSLVHILMLFMIESTS